MFVVTFSFMTLRVLDKTVKYIIISNNKLYKEKKREKK